ncbi:MAG: hypothetical protein L6R41_002579 [Letrouitia leprolyta]|nr:MAG: hypothetical protein L6R41_002579 [Letrouitia leprolyta]
MKNAKDSKAMTADEELEIMDNTLADMQEAMIVDTDDTETEPYPDRSLWKRIGAMLLWTDEGHYLIRWKMKSPSSDVSA